MRLVLCVSTNNKQCVQVFAQLVIGLRVVADAAHFDRGVPRSDGVRFHG
jgi:hypothetical protein